MKYMPLFLVPLGASHLVRYLTDRDPATALLGVGFVLLGLGWYLTKGLALTKKSIPGSVASAVGLTAMAVAVLSLILRCRRDGAPLFGFTPRFAL